MKFAMDTCREIAHGSNQRRIHALFTLLLWFAAGGFLFSGLSEYVGFIDEYVHSVVGGILVSGFAVFVKFS